MLCFGCLSTPDNIKEYVEGETFTFKTTESILLLHSSPKVKQLATALENFGFQLIFKNGHVQPYVKLNDKYGPLNPYNVIGKDSLVIIEKNVKIARLTLYKNDLLLYIPQISNENPIGLLVKE